MVNLDKILRALSIRYSTRESGNRTAYIVECPYCTKGKHKDASGAFFTNGNKISYKCWRDCKPSNGGAFRVLADISGRSIKEVIETVNEYSDSIIMRTDNTVTRKVLSKPIDIGLDEYYINYLKKRGFIPEIVSSKYELMFTPHESYFFKPNENSKPMYLSNNIVFPVYDKWGNLLTFSGRTIEMSNRRYTIPHKEDEVVSIKTTGVGLGTIGDVLVITEGAFDAMKIGGVACCGISYTPGFVKTILEYWKAHKCRVCVMFDNETKAQQAQRKMESELGLIIGDSLIKYKYPFEHDLGDCTRSEIEEIQKGIGMSVNVEHLSEDWSR